MPPKSKKKSGGLGTPRTRWGREERELAWAYFAGEGKKKNLNLDRLLSSKEYMDRLQPYESAWMRHPIRNFRQNMKRHISEWRADENIRNFRRQNVDSSTDDERKNEAPSDDDVEDDDEDDDDEDGGGGDSKCFGVFFLSLALTPNSSLPES